jgi:tetratricopeptide (TPR) repeat protein
MPIALISGCAGRIFAAAAVFTLGLAGCASYGDSAALIQRDLTAQRPERALQRLQKMSVPNTDRALYLLNEGMLLHLAGKWQDSNAAFEAAQRLMKDLAALSIREQGTSLLVNDYTRSYEGEPYDKIMLHVYKALNYLALQQPYDARVEALQLDVQLRSLAEAAGGRDPELGFARYLTGMIYEELGEWSDAMIAYRQAYEAYKRHARDYGVPVPASLKVDLLRMARKEGLHNELEKYQKEFASEGDGDLPPGSPGSRLGELVLVFNDGLAPYKREHSVAMVDPGTGRLLRISLPYYQERRPQVAAARLTVGDADAATEVVENINAVALADLDAQMPMIAARSLARVIAKKKMEDSAARDSPIAGALLNVAAVLTEEADTRSWNTLPYNIQLVRMPLAPGHYPLKLELMDDGHRVVATPQLGDIVIRAEHKTFVSYYWSASSPIGGH